MTSTEIISIIVTFIGVVSFATVFTILYQSYANSSIVEIKSGKRDIELIDEVIYEKQEKTKRKRKRNRLIKNIIFYVIMIIIIPIFIFSIINKFTGGTAMIGNHSIMAVASGSMSEKNKANDYLVTNNLNNQFNTYDIIILEKVNQSSDLNVYDVIAYVNDKGITVIHRIISINYENGKQTFTTRGDSNNASDAYHPSFEDIVGRYSNKRIKGLGIFIVFFQSYPGIITIVSMVYCLIMIDKVSKKMESAQEERVIHLKEIIEEINDDKVQEEMKASYSETIYYKGIAYIFDENGFVGKDEIKDESLIVQSNENIIKVKNEKNDCGGSL
ncbi:MAG: signal peptidase I [Erysipelotrichaceae bacterium]|nr:signal peptidase I [Erysipelotrichaceae bacterium]